jgi:hypothetical protein
MAAAMADRIKRARLAILAHILPLNDPVRVAEELAMLDCLSGGPARPLRQFCGAREHDRRDGLWARRQSPSPDCLGEALGARRGRSAGQEAALGAIKDLLLSCMLGWEVERCATMSAWPDLLSHLADET